MGLALDASTVEEAPGWILDKMATEKNETKILLAKVLWGIWNARNLKVWEQKLLTPSIAMQWSNNQIVQWQKARKKQMKNGTSQVQHHGSDDCRWKAPTENRIKLKVDASVVPGSYSFSLGMVIRNHHGDFIQAKNLRLTGEVTVFEAEARGVLEAIKWLQALQLSSADIETNSLLTVNAIKRQTEYKLEVVDVLDECHSILDDSPDVAISFVKKAGQ